MPRRQPARADMGLAVHLAQVRRIAYAIVGSLDFSRNNRLRSPEFAKSVSLAAETFRQRPGIPLIEFNLVAGLSSRLDRINHQVIDRLKRCSGQDMREEHTNIRSLRTTNCQEGTVREGGKPSLQRDVLLGRFSRDVRICPALGSKRTKTA